MKKAVKTKKPLVGVAFADRTGLEPATSAVTGRHSNQLNYRSVCPFRECKYRPNILFCNIYFIKS
jgi:hypothetical protein